METKAFSSLKFLPAKCAHTALVVILLLAASFLASSNLAVTLGRLQAPPHKFVLLFLFAFDLGSFRSFQI